MRSLPNLIKQYNGMIHPAPSASQPGNPIPEETEEPVSQEELTAQSQNILDMAFEQAEEILAAAQERSTAQLKEAVEQSRRECDDLRKKSQEEGYAQGLEAGKKEGREAGWQEGFTEGMQTAADANAAVLQELQTLLETVEQQRENVLQRQENDLSTLAVAIAKKVLKRELALDKDAIRTILVSALDSYRNQTWIRINVSPETARTLLRTNGTIADALQEVSENVKVVPAPQLSDTDCIVEMPDQAIDAGVDSQLHKIEQALK